MEIPSVHILRDIHIFRLPAVCRATGLSRSMLYQLETSSQFPRRVKIGARAVGWIEAEVQSWLANRVMRSLAPHTERQRAANAAPQSSM